MYQRYTSKADFMTSRNRRAGCILFVALWETIYAFCQRPTESKEQIARLQHMIHNMNWIASNISKQPDLVEKTLKSTVSEPLVEAADESVCGTATRKRKAIDTANPKPRQTKKTKKNRATSALKRSEPTALPKQILPLASPTSQVDNRTLGQSNKHNMYDETTLPSTKVALSNETRRITTSLVRLSPSGKGDNWLNIWANIVGASPINEKTGDNPRWIPLLTKVLTHTFGYDGVNNVLQMANQVYNNRELLEIDATTSLDGAQDSPLRSAAVRLKNVWARLKGDALMTVEAMVYYKELAEDFRRLEGDTYRPETSIGQDWLEHSKGRTRSVQVRRNFVLQRLLEYIKPATTDPTANEDKKKKDTAKLQKERLMARNIDLMVRLFGHGILPLMGNTSWRETFSQYAAATAEPLLTELLAQCPTLRQICNRIDKNFYQYVRIRAKIVDLPEDCLNGCSVSIESHKKHTLAYLLAAPGELEESVDSMEEGMHVTPNEYGKRSSTKRSVEVEEERGIEGGLFSDL
ncbi:hypothetical protein KCU78_g8591, partial [Aureobasidium melanogenum]